MPIDIQNIIDVKNKTNNIITSNDNIDQKEYIPILNLYQPLNTRPIATVSNQDIIKPELNNLESNKQDSNIKETFSSTKNKDVIMSSLINNPNMKKIYHLEFIQKNIIINQSNII